MIPATTFHGIRLCHKAIKAVIEWGKKVEPRDAALGLIAVDIMNAEYQKQN